MSGANMASIVKAAIVTAILALPYGCQGAAAAVVRRLWAGFRAS